MPVTPPDFALVERTFERRLRELNLSPRLVDRGAETGYDRLVLHQEEMQVAREQALGPAPRKRWWSWLTGR